MDASERKAALGLARNALESWVRKRKTMSLPVLPPVFKEKRGCFVTLKRGGELRGCIGFPEPIMLLAHALVEAAKEAAEDPRFPRVKADELNAITIEVSVLTKPSPLNGERKDAPKLIKVGRDGLIIRHSPFSGLLLPQVATEWHFNAEQFLDQTCLKAGLDPGDWHDKKTEVLTFQAEVFSESEP